MSDGYAVALNVIEKLLQPMVEFGTDKGDVNGASLTIPTLIPLVQLSFFSKIVCNH
jgi:hypothetical protein